MLQCLKIEDLDMANILNIPCIWGFFLFFLSYDFIVIKVNLTIC